MSTKSTPLLDQAFPAPKRFLMTRIDWGDGAMYHTFLASYVGLSDTTEEPNLDILERIAAFDVDTSPDGEKETEVVLTAFYDSSTTDLLDFTRALHYKVYLDTARAKTFMAGLEADRHFIVLIHTEAWRYKALVERDTGEVIEFKIEFSFLN